MLRRCFFPTGGYSREMNGGTDWENEFSGSHTAGIMGKLSKKCHQHEESFCFTQGVR